MMITLIIPAYNEEKNIAGVLRKIPKKYKNVIVVDDGSNDRTSEIAKKYCKVIKTKHFGKGHACKTGLKSAKSDFVVFIDGDGQLNPKDIIKIEKLLKNSDVVVGQRNWNKIPFKRRISNSFARRAVRIITGKKFNDVLCGLRGLNKNKIDWSKIGDGYSFEVDTLIYAAKNNLRISSVDVDVNYNIGSRMPLFESLKLSAKLILLVFKSLFKK
jgi:glycosyltransferase involved in cell wall biosynthesis